MKKSLKYFSLILFCSFFMFLLVSNPVEANYNPEKNTINISVNKDEVRITVRYQRGIDKGQAFYAWCKRDGETDNKCNNDFSSMDLGNKVSYIRDQINYIAEGDADYADNNPTLVTFVVSKDKDPFLKAFNDGTYDPSEQHFLIVVTHVFCAVRKDGYQSCEYFDSENITTSLKVSGNDLANGRTIGGTGASTDTIEDEGLKTMMEKIYDIVHGTVMPIIWGVLGLFLIIKGSLLGVQIVKSADEPQVRQEKVGALKWLVIGVGIAYASSFLVDSVIGFFSDVFK